MRADGGGSATTERDIVFGRGGDLDLRLDVIRPPAGNANHTAVLHVFGGGFTRGSKAGHYLGCFELLAERGYVCVAPQYRLAGEGKWPTQIHDLKAAIRWTRANAEYLGVSPEKIAIAGYSAGGQLALVCAGTPDRPDLEGQGGNAGISTAVAACIAYYPSRVWRPQEGGDHPLMREGSSDEDYRRTEPLTYVAAGFPPTILLCGTADFFLEPTQRLFDALREKNVAVELHLLAGLPHIFDRYPEFAAVSTELCDLFLDRHVANPRVYEAYARLPRRAETSVTSGGT